MLQCIREDVVLSGDYNTAAASQLVIAFTPCRNEDSSGAQGAISPPANQVKCKPEADIKRWMRRKFILLLENQVEFNKDLVEQEKI